MGDPALENDPALAGFNKPAEYVKHTVKSGFRGALVGALVGAAGVSLIGAVLGAVSFSWIPFIGIPLGTAVGTAAVSAIGGLIAGAMFGAKVGGVIGLANGALGAEDEVERLEGRRLERSDRAIARATTHELTQARMNKIRADAANREPGEVTPQVGFGMVARGQEPPNISAR